MDLFPTLEPFCELSRVRFDQPVEHSIETDSYREPSKFDF